MHRARADLHSLDHIYGRDRAEELIELRLGVHELAVRLTTRRGDRCRDFQMLRAIRRELALASGRRGRAQRVESTLERAHRYRSKAVALLNRLPLLRELQHAVECLDRSGADQRIHSSTTA